MTSERERKVQDRIAAGFTPRSAGELEQDVRSMVESPAARSLGTHARRLLAAVAALAVVGAVTLAVSLAPRGSVRTPTELSSLASRGSTAHAYVPAEKGAAGHMVAGADLLKKSPRAAPGAQSMSLATARNRASFELKVPPVSVNAGDSLVQRVLLGPSDGGVGVNIQYRKYQITETPTNDRTDFSGLLNESLRRDVSDPASAVRRYRAAKIGRYTGVAGEEFAQYDRGVLIANAPAVVSWVMPAPDGSGAKYLTMSLSGWDMSEAQLLRIAESLVD